ncbi:MAG TPA: hypothetical protein VMY40_10975 [Anaerolineae bacterium]|nr:hypothetical protein [Anaerolineae bacterium]
MSEEHTVAGDAATEIGPGVSEVQAIHDEALSIWERDAGGVVDEPEGGEGNQDVEPDPDTDNDHELVAETAESDEGAEDDQEAEGDPDDKAAGMRMADYTRKTQALAEERKKIEADREQLRSVLAELEARKTQPQQAAEQPAANPEPQRPGPDATESDWVAYWEKRQEWTAETKIQQAVAAGAFRDPRIDALAQQQAAVERSQAIMARLTQQEGFDEHVSESMFKATQESDFWAAAVQTEQGALELFRQVKKQQAAEKVANDAEASIRRSAGASKGKVSPPAGRARAKPIQKDAREMSLEDLQAEARRLSGFA